MLQNNSRLYKKVLKFVFFGYFALVFACSSEKKEKECVDPPPAPSKKVTEMPLPMKSTVDKSKADWCRACVMGPKGWASCMKVYAENEGETRDLLKNRARDKACVDSGYEKDKCPQQSVIALTCKGDAPPKGTTTPGKALQQLFHGGKKGAQLKVKKIDMSKQRKEPSSKQKE